MSSRAPLYREVYRLIEQRLRARGMQKYEQGIYGREVTASARGMVGLNVATKYGFSINPIIAVQFLPLEHLLAQLTEGQFHPTGSGHTIARPIGYLGPANMYWEWKFEEGRDNAATVAEMVHEITTIGFRYMEENSTLKNVCERIAVDHHFIFHPNDVYQLPVGYLMLGRFDEAETIVRDHLQEIETENGPTVEELEAKYGKLKPVVLAECQKYEVEPILPVVNYRRFAERFFQKLEEQRRQADG